MKHPYKISIPFMNHSCDTDAHRAQFLQLVRRAGAERIFLCMSRYMQDSEARRKALELLKVNIAYFKENGVKEVGTWFSSMGHGGPLDHEDAEERSDFPRVVGFGGGICDDTFCIADPGYRNAIADYVRDMGAAGADIIQLDDDLRLGYRSNGIGCTCDYHMREIARRTGREWTRDELYKTVYGGKPNAVRRAWFDLMREGFEGFAQALRAALDTVSPDIRLGYCAAPCSFDADCIDTIALSRIFAGRTKPFLRATGAPYWANSGSWHNIEDTVSFVRQESAWMQAAPDIEFFSEGDVYPRPRYRVPAWFLETYDTALRAGTSTDGILKYMFDYVQTPMYETGYLSYHERNASLYREIENAFEGTTRGVYAYDPMHKLLTAEFPEEGAQTKTITGSPLSASVRFLNCVCTPASMTENGDAVCVFGESARTVSADLFKNGAILDMPAAWLLHMRGIDCGLNVSGTSLADLKPYLLETPPEEEHFPSICGYEAECVRPMSGGMFYRAELKPGADVLSVFQTKDGAVPAAWYYENTDGQRFLVYSFDMASADLFAPLFTSYSRQIQFRCALENIQGRPAAAVCVGHPHLYMIVMDRPDGSRAVGMWNCFGDDILTPEVTLDRSFSEIAFIGGAQGKIEADRVTFTTDIPAHSFRGFIVK